MARSIVPEAEAILDQEFKVHNHGFVRLVDYMGGDARIVQAARVSYGEGTKTVREDAGLIDYLLRNQHTSPFEQVVLTFHIKLPIFVARQWIRHRTARLNEISGRYSVMKDEFWLPEKEALANQSKNNKQGRAGEPLPAGEAEAIISQLDEGQRNAYREYSRLIDAGLARELARVNLPLSMYTEWYWQMDLHNLFHFLALRLDPHAQKEIRDYAQVILEIAKKVAPLATESFIKNRVGGALLNSREVEAVRALLSDKDAASGNTPADKLADSLQGRDLERFREKLGL